MVIPVLITGLCAQNVSYGSIVFVFQSQTRRLKLMILFLCAKVVNVNVDEPTVKGRGYLHCNWRNG